MASEKLISPLGHLVALDGLRGVAILVVFVGHANHVVFRGSFIGVDIFFCLSGFLITSLLLQEWEEKDSINLRNFYLRRALRLLPALFVFLALSVAYACLFLDPKRRVGLLISAVGALCYIENWRQAFGWFELKDYGLGHTWSLSVEEQFYLLWPLALLGLLKLKSRSWLVVAVIGAAILSVAVERAVLWDGGVGFQRLYRGLDTRADSLLAGAGAGMIGTWQLLNPRARAVRWLLGAAVVISIVFVGLTILAIKWPQDQMQMFLGRNGGFSLIAVSVASILLWLRMYPGTWLDHLLETDALVWLGKISYGVYLWHWFIFAIVDEHPPRGGWVIIVSLKFVLTIVAALISYRYVEIPFLKRKARFAPRPFACLPVSAAQDSD